MIKATTEKPIQNSNAWSTRQLVTMALLSALGIILSFIELPIFPAAPFLKYDPSFIVAMTAGFAFGSAPGVAVGFIVAFVHGLIMGDFWGSLMNIIVVIGFVVPASLIYKRNHTWKGAVIGLCISGIVAIACAIAGNLIITPIFTGAPLEAIIKMIIPILIPFNILKTVLNCVLTLIVYKSISNLMTPKKKQVKGRK